MQIKHIAPIVIALLLCTFATLRAAEPNQTDVFVARQDGYPIYRIPALVVSKAGTLLAFAEGRSSIHDQASNKIVLKRSTDSGKTWSPLQIIAESGKDALNNPCAITLRDSGRILLMYQRYPFGRAEHSVTVGTSGDTTCLGYLTFSDDDGKTWSPPADITAQIKYPDANSIASGPGIAIQLRHGPHAGRILFPFNHLRRKKCDVYCAYSDDNGSTWHLGQCVPEGPDGRGNEVQAVELSDGRVMLNSRTSGTAAAKPFRKIACSDNAGVTWSAFKDDPALIESRCQGSIIRYSDTGPLIFCNPATQKGRTRGTVRLSNDDGKTWPIQRELHPGSFAYCCLAVLPDGSIACLYECDNYQKITLARFDLAWLTSAPPAPAPESKPAQ